MFHQRVLRGSVAHKEGGCAPHEGEEEGASGRHGGTLMENVGWARQQEDVAATRTSVHRQGQNCIPFEAKMNCSNLMWKGNKGGDLSKRGVSGTLEMVLVLFP